MGRICLDSLRCVVWCLVLIIWAMPSYAQNATACSAGKQRCEPLSEFPEKYDRCMQLICATTNQATESNETESSAASSSAQENPSETAEATPASFETCDNGLRRCNDLREQNERYWLCMRTTCEDKELSQKDPHCQSGRLSCVRELERYRNCVSLICGTGTNEYKTCPAGETSCGTQLTSYWDCVSDECLGSTDEFKRADVEFGDDDDIRYYTNIAGQKQRMYKAGDPNMPMLGVHPRYALPPPGVSLESYLSWEIPPSLRVTNDLLSKVECRNRSASVSCTGNHLGSCMCSDGTWPMSKEKIREEGYASTVSGKN